MNIVVTMFRCTMEKIQKNNKKREMPIMIKSIMIRFIKSILPVSCSWRANPKEEPKMRIKTQLKIRNIR